ncbi:hypothetical protein HMPREF3159_03605 [Brachybacterium sp. HMSC06H03]|uniref:hypothetical protein n=1 Tax=Brachybacterium sp. HMSC06H03 TaxID=1581127 RepID=UPI0008A48B97|nr:hypothetical protein [Brachybacterium sp. HMSC06H03]OFT62611.1 hypothetical protein HMPREF3159_03605 [Brachybacterium sp. HMSC06H03]
MTDIIEGDIIAAPSSGEMTAWKSRIAALEASDPERAELEITDALTFSNEMLRAVSDVTAQSPTTGADLASAGIGAAKLTAVRAAEFSKRLDLSKDTVLEAQMQQRRWERALGTAIREGQAVGEIRSNGQHASCGAVSSPSDYAKQVDLTHPERGIYALADNATDAEFESALTTARDEGNVSRANVVRKLKSDGVIDMATGEVIAPDSLTPENRAERQAERERMLNLYTDAQNLTGALNRLNMLGDPRHVENFLEIHRISTTRPDFPNKHHNPADIRRIAQYLTEYATALEEQP